MRFHVAKRAIPIRGKVKPYERIVLRAFVEHMAEGTSTRIVLRPLKRMGGKGDRIGDVRYEDLERGLVEIRFRNEGSLAYRLGHIAHEMTHVRQYDKGHLRVEGGSFIWHGKPYLTVEEYAAITDYHTHAKLPWEAEAIKAAKTIPRPWLDRVGPTLRGQDRLLDYLIDNDLLGY